MQVGGGGGNSRVCFDSERCTTNFISRVPYSSSLGALEARVLGTFRSDPQGAAIFCLFKLLNVLLRRGPVFAVSALAVLPVHFNESSLLPAPAEAKLSLSLFSLLSSLVFCDDSRLNPRLDPQFVARAPLLLLQCPPTAATKNASLLFSCMQI